jgi:hypothetical protein
MADPELKDKTVLSEVADTKNSLSTDRMDFSFGEIMNMYERNEIIVDPEFQRLFRWSNDQQTRFIESLLLGIPIPPIFVAEDSDGKWELVDGLQRISTVLSFFGILKTFPEKNRWGLTKGDFVPSLEGYTIDTLPIKLNLNLKRASCRVEIINWNSKMDLRYELFKRLNTGGSRLTDQEIRNCIFRGQTNEINKFLITMAQKEQFLKLLLPTPKQVQEKYPEELILRFISLVDDYEKMTDSLSIYMTDFMKDVVDGKKAINLNDLEKLFDRTIGLLYPLGSEIFRGDNGSFSSSYYDGMMIGIARNIDFYERKQDVMSQRVKKLKTNEKFKKYMGTGAATKDRVIGRIRAAVEVFTP